MIDSSTAGEQLELTCILTIFLFCLVHIIFLLIKKQVANEIYSIYYAYSSTDINILHISIGMYYRSGVGQMHT
jgi:hypothetical protein